jgi:hypothetical protein
MFEVFQDLENDIETRTDLVLLLDDPSSRDSNFTKMVTFSAEGKMRVVTGHFFRVSARAFDVNEDEGGKNEEDISILPWRVTMMEASGDSLLGEIKVTNFADRVTFGTVRQKQADSLFPAILEAEVCTEVNVPTYGKLHTITPVPIKAEINSIPPFGVEAKHTNSGILVDENLEPRGMIVGKSITLIGPAKSRRSVRPRDSKVSARPKKR